MSQTQSKGISEVPFHKTKIVYIRAVYTIKSKSKHSNLKNNYSFFLHDIVFQLD